MRFIPAEQQCWALQPLLDAGLDTDEINDLLVRLCFDAMVSADRGAASDPMTTVADRTAEVRAAWAETIDRMVRLDPDPDSDDGAVVSGTATPRYRRTRRPRSGRRGSAG